MTSPIAGRDDQTLDPERGADHEIAIVGAGAVGSTAAYELARRGADVTVYERGEIAAGASGRAAGVCYDAVTGEPAATLAAEAIERFRSLSGPDTFEFRDCPYVWFARGDDEENVSLIEAGLSRMAEQDLDTERLDPEELADRYPALWTDDVAVAGLTEGAGHADPGSYTRALVESASQEGATLRTGTAVGIERDSPRVVRPDGTEHEVDAVLVAAGAHSKRLLADAGVDIAMKPYRVQALTAATDQRLPMWYDTTAGCYARPHPEGLLAGDGTEHVEADPDAYDRDGDEWFRESLVEHLRHRIPDWTPAVHRMWAGLCTATPDRKPLVGRLDDGLYLTTGFQGQGFMRSPATGRRIAEQMLGGPALDAFDPLRFDGDEEFSVREGMSIAEEE
jgi:sarcosine oxidase subunit beta